MNRPRGLVVAAVAAILIPPTGIAALGQVPRFQPGRASQSPDGPALRVAPTPLRLVDAQGHPIAGAVVATYFTRDVDRESRFTPGEEVESRTSDQHGEVSLPLGIPVRREGVGIYAIRPDRDRLLVGVHTLTREQVGQRAMIVMHPACRVRLRVECPGFRELRAKFHAELGGPDWEWAAYVMLGEGPRAPHPLFTRSTTGHLEFLLPPGRYTILAYGSATAGESQSIEIGPGHRVRNLGIVEVLPSRLAQQGIFRDFWRSVRPDPPARWDGEASSKEVVIRPPRWGPAPKGSIPSIRDLAFSPDGKLLATAHGYSQRPGEVKLWSVQTGELAATLAVPGGEDGVHELAFAPDGRILAGSVGSMDILSLPSVVVLWDVAGRREPRVLRGHSATVTAVAFAPDGRTLASGGADRTVRFWDLASGRESGRIEVEPEWPLAVAYAPDGKTLAIASGEALKLWDIPGNRLRAPLEAEGFWVQSLAFAPDGRTLAAAGAAVGPDHQVREGHVRLYDVTQDPPARRATLTREIEAPLRANLGQDLFGDVVFTPDGRRVASITRSTLAIWDAATGVERDSLDRTFLRSQDHLAISPDGRWLAVTEAQGVKLIDIVPPPLP
jgi:WD40 repeat protein